MTAPEREDILDPIADALMRLIYNEDDPVKVVGRWSVDLIWDTVAPLVLAQRDAAISLARLDIEDAIEPKGTEDPSYLQGKQVGLRLALAIIDQHLSA